MKTRIGKIARLPKEIREQLNHRLENGEPGTALVQWLNQLPEVQKILTDQFASQPIRAQNLSDWKNGGYTDWLRHQQLRELVRSNAEQADDFSEDEDGNDISDSLGSFIAAQLLIHAHELEKITDPQERWERFRQVARELSRMRRDDHRYRRNQLRREQWEATLEPEKTNSAPEEPKTELPSTHPPIHQSNPASCLILPNPG